MPPGSDPDVLAGFSFSIYEEKNGHVAKETDAAARWAFAVGKFGKPPVPLFLGVSVPRIVGIRWESVWPDFGAEPALLDLLGGPVVTGLAQAYQFAGVEFLAAAMMGRVMMGDYRGDDLALDLAPPAERVLL